LRMLPQIDRHPAAMGSRARSARSGFQNNGMERGKAGKAAADFYHAPAGLLELPRKRDVPPPAPGTGDGSAIRDSPQSVGGVSSLRFLVSSVSDHHLLPRPVET